MGNEKRGKLKFVSHTEDKCQLPYVFRQMQRVALLYRKGIAGVTMNLSKRLLS